MSVPKPSAPRRVDTDIDEATIQLDLDALDYYEKKSNPKPSAPRRERSAPVRNPAFREHEGLKELQKQLNSNGRKG